MRKSTFVALVAAAALSMSGCGWFKSGGSPTQPSPGPNPSPDVFPPASPVNIPPGTSITSVKAGYFTISDMIVGPGPGSVLKVTEPMSSWSVRFRITMSCEAPDQFGFGFFPGYQSAYDDGTPFPPNTTTLFSGRGRMIRACESAVLEESGPIFTGAGIMDVPNLIIRVSVGQSGGTGWLRGSDFSIENAVARVNLRKGS